MTAVSPAESRTGQPQPGPAGQPAPTVGVMLRACERRFAEAGLDTPALDARLLVGFVLGLRREQLLTERDRPLSAEQAERCHRVVDERLKGRPVSRIIGSRGFWTLDLTLGPDTLDPRPDTETVVEATLAAIDDRSRALTVVDLGTGTGCILLALLSELPNARGVGVDRSFGAVGVARNNAAAAGLSDRASFMVGDWASAITGPVDVIVSNPPYIPAGEIDGLAVEVRDHDPRVALDGGEDGLAAYRVLIPEASGCLAVDGRLVLEIGAGQTDAVSAIVTAARLTVLARVSDLAGIERCLIVAPPDGVA